MNTNKILIVVLIVNILLIGVLAYFMQKAVNECLGDPLVFGAKKLTKSNDAEFSCSCSLDKPNSPFIFFNSKNFTVEYNNRFKNIDLKDFEVFNVS